jgi:hypothetical protein
LVTYVIKRPGGRADNPPMIISDEQVQLALRDLHKMDCSGGSSRGTAGLGCPPELLRRVADSVALMPELRSDRVERARAYMAENRFSAQDVASKIIGRVISDSLR